MSAFDQATSVWENRHLCANVIDNLLKLIDRAGKPRRPIAAKPVKVIFEARQKPSNLPVQVRSRPFRVAATSRRHEDVHMQPSEREESNIVWVQTLNNDQSGG